MTSNRGNKFFYDPGQHHCLKLVNTNTVLASERSNFECFYTIENYDLVGTNLAVFGLSVS